MPSHFSPQAYHSVGYKSKNTIKLLSSQAYIGRHAYPAPHSFSSYISKHNLLTSNSHFYFYENTDMDFLWFYNDTAGLQLKYLDNIDIFGLVHWTNIISKLLSRISYLQNILWAFIIWNCLNFAHFLQASLLFLRQPFRFNPQNYSCDARWKERTFEQWGMSVPEIVSFFLILRWTWPFKPPPASIFSSLWPSSQIPAFPLNLVFLPAPKEWCCHCHAF